MALSTNFISFIFFTTLLFSLQTNARESQFFSKVTNVNNNNAKETTDLPYKEGPVNKPEQQQQQQQPAFIPESENSYGLYGHQDESYKTNTEFEDNNKYFNYDNNAFNNNNNNQNNEFSNTRLTGTGYYSNNNNYNKDNAFGGYQNENELSDTKYTEEGSGYNSMENQNNNQMYYNNNNERYNNNNNAANENYFYSSNNNNYNNGANNKYNGERQGMSDTRFMHGGKYFYDVNSEKYSTPLHGDAYKGFNNQNWYTTTNNNNNNNNYNEYQNQENFEDEFDNSQP